MDDFTRDFCSLKEAKKGLKSKTEKSLTKEML